MTKAPLTVVVPIYNPGVFLKQLMSSMEQAARTLQLRLRVELSNDCSPSPLPELVVSDWLEIREHRNVVNLGEGENVNATVKRLAAEGVEWVLLIHQDDLVSAGWLQLCAEWVVNWNPNMAEFMFAENEGLYDLESIPQSCSLVGTHEPTPSVVDIPSGQPGIDYVSDNWAWIPSGSLLRTKAFLRMGGFHPHIRYAGDNDFMVRWLLSGQTVRQVKRRFVYKRIHSGASTARCLRMGWDSDGWCYLMQRYAELSPMVRVRRNHYTWLYRDARMLLSFLYRRDAQLISSRLRGISIGLRSLLAVHLPGLRFLLPASVHELLKNSPVVPASSSPRNSS